MTDKPDLLADYELEDTFAARYSVTVRTSARYRKNGLPYMLFGGKVYIHLPGAAEWMAKRTLKLNQRRVA